MSGLQPVEYLWEYGETKSKYGQNRCEINIERPEKPIFLFYKTLNQCYYRLLVHNEGINSQCFVYFFSRLFSCVKGWKQWSWLWLKFEINVKFLPRAGKKKSIKKHIWTLYAVYAIQNKFSFLLPCFWTMFPTVDIDVTHMFIW